MRGYLSGLILLLLLTLGTARAQYNPRNATPPIPSAQIPPPAANFANQSAAQSAPVNPPAPATTTSASPTTAAPHVISMPDSMDKIDDHRLLITGDVINFRVVEDKDPPRSLSINDSGDIEVPFVGRVHAAGKTLRKLADELKGLLEKDYYYQATVLLSMDMMNRVRGKVYVVGQVRAPGGLDIPSDENFTVSKAILRAGGFGDFADQRKVKLVRKKDPAGKETETTLVDCKEIFQTGDTSKDPTVQPEDLIIVPQRLVNF